jgi:hypothetical protein
MTPKIREWLPNWAPMAGIVLFGFILVKRNPRAGLVRHEVCHWTQQREMGMLRFYWRYLFPKSRVAIEAEAYAIQVRMGEERLEWCAQVLSGWLYLKPCTYEYALEAIRSRV